MNSAKTAIGTGDRVFPVMIPYVRQGPNMGVELLFMYFCLEPHIS